MIKNLDIIKNKNYFLGFSLLLVVASILCVVVFGLKLGIDLEGGTQWQVMIQKSDVTEDGIQSVLKQGSEKTEVLVKKADDGSFLVRTHTMSNEEHQTSLKALETAFGTIEEKNFSSIGPAIGAELKQNAMWAIVAVLLGISLYIAWAFRKVSEPVKSWKYGVATLLSLFHDVAIPTGMLAVLGIGKGIEIDTNFIVALLVVMGFSVHDTIVVFDRIRENLIRERGKKTQLGDIINYSVRETFARSVNTSFTLFLVLLALLLFGPASLFYFILTILVGTIFGTYSSIFVASPLLYLWQRR